MRSQHFGAARRGFFLIDLMVGLTVGAALAVVIFTLLAQLVKVGPSSQQHLEQQLTFGRLASQWRHDVHAATEVNWSAKDRIATIAFETDHIAKYRVTPTAIEREELVGMTAGRRETYRIAGADIIIGPGEEKPSMATLSVPSRRTNTVGPGRRESPLQASAVVGRDYQPRG